MAALETTRPVTTGHLLGGRVSAIVAHTFASFAAWNDTRVTRNALDKLSDRELDDIGLSRGDIDLLAAPARR